MTVNTPDHTTAARATLSAVGKLEEQLRASIDSVTRVQEAMGVVDVLSSGLHHHHYKTFPAEAHRLLRAWQNDEPAQKSRALHFLVILSALKQTLLRRLSRPLPPRLAENQLHHFHRMVHKGLHHEAWLDCENDLFQKECGLATERLYAAGSQLVDPWCGIPRSVVWRGGPARCLSNAAVFMQARGFKPFMQIHTHTFNLDRFNETGWNACYAAAAELYSVYPHLLGMFGSSWFYDPEILRITPRLGYLQEVPRDGGAHFMFFERGGSAIDNATATSASRRQLFESGQYMPTSYMLVWQRQHHLAWAAQAR